MTTRHTPIILLTGFEPFGGETVNPSWQAVLALDGKRIAGHRIHARCLPVAFDASLKALRKALRETRPTLVLCVGLTGGRAQLSLERVAINLVDARIADNSGAQPIDAPVIADGPAAYFTTLPIKAMLQALRKAGIPVEISQTAGTYVCNQVFYGLMHALRARRSIRAGFMHIPYSPQQAAAQPGMPSLHVDIVVRAMQVAVRTAIDTQHDERIAAGAEH